MKELREDRRPADLWFWSDWLSSVDVRSCSLAAQGLWINMLSIMSRADRKGFLSINGKPMTSKELAKFVGVYNDEVDRLLIELEYYNVFSRDEDGTIYNRRMVKESDLSKKRADAGRLGGLKQKASKPQAKSGSKRKATLESDNEDEYETNKEEVLNRWNAFAAERGLATIKSIPPDSKRDRSLRARLADKDFDFAALLDEIAQSGFLLGEKTDFKAAFDWIIAPSNYQKIIEGNYRGRGEKPKENALKDFDDWAKKGAR